ncbi:DUF2515 family protein [Falsibacillus pallidus]|uniref:DUF2515 family protein n=1 Tax=Falsibacillus pallidus TaxID=493781 RepID=UPI003D9694C1
MKKINDFHNFFPKSYKNISESEILDDISAIVFKGNLDNISRTEYYQKFYFHHPEIRWSFLASMVSRNAGWNMCDLMSTCFLQGISPEIRERLFLTYERANWLIFHDAFPQLLIYHYSTVSRKPLFHFLKKFMVSDFMIKEWLTFWHGSDSDRLTKALIINEQNLIQKPIINHPVYKKRVFKTILFHFQEYFHFSCVVFPTLIGNLYGASVSRFSKLDERIELGKRLDQILFHPDLYPRFLDFSKKVEHTGSRYDYEKVFKRRPLRTTPFLRTVYPVVEHHIREQADWSLEGSHKEKWFYPAQLKEDIHLTDWFLHKRFQQQRILTIKTCFTTNKES